MKLVATTFFIIFAFSFSASSQEASGQYKIVEPPKCINNKGETVKFRERTGGRLKVAAGMANRDGEGIPFILRMNYAFSPMQFQKFIDRHECAHHQTGDVDRLHPPRNSPEHLMNESVSDCIAILRLRDEEDYDAEQLKTVTSAMRNDMAKIGYPEISISSRISNVENCYARDGSSADFIKIIKNRRAQEQ